MFERLLEDFEKHFTDETPVEIDEKAPPGMEPWIKKNKQKFVQRYGEDKGLEVLYATAWKRHNAKEDAVGAGGRQATMKDKPENYLKGQKFVGG